MRRGHGSGAAIDTRAGGRALGGRPSRQGSCRGHRCWRPAQSGADRGRWVGRAAAAVSGVGYGSAPLWGGRQGQVEVNRDHMISWLCSRLTLVPSPVRRRAVVGLESAWPVRHRRELPKGFQACACGGAGAPQGVCRWEAGARPQHGRRGSPALLRTGGTLAHPCSR